MWEVFNLVSEGVGAPFDVILIMIIGVGGLIFYAEDFKKGVVSHFIFFGLLFMYLYFLNQFDASVLYVRALVIFLLFLVLMTFTLYSSAKASSVGGIQ